MKTRKINKRPRPHFTLCDNTVDIRDLGYFIHQKITGSRDLFSMQGDDEASVITDGSMSNPDQSSFRTLLINPDTKSGEKVLNDYVLEQKEWEDKAQRELTTRRYTKIFPVSTLLDRSFASGFTIFQEVQVRPIQYEQLTLQDPFIGRKLYFLVHKSLPIAYLIECRLTSKDVDSNDSLLKKAKHVSQELHLYYAYIHSRNFAYTRPAFEPILWYKYAIFKNNEVKNKQVIVSFDNKSIDVLAVHRILQQLSRGLKSARAQRKLVMMTLVKDLLYLRTKRSNIFPTAQAYEFAKEYAKLLMMLTYEFDKQNFFYLLIRIRHVLQTGKILMTHQEDTVYISKGIHKEEPEIDIELFRTCCAAFQGIMPPDFIKQDDFRKPEWKKQRRINSSGRRKVYFFQDFTANAVEFFVDLYRESCIISHAFFKRYRRKAIPESGVGNFD